MQIEVQRSAPFPRFFLAHQGRVWNGKKWLKRPRKPLLFANTEAAFAELAKLEPELQRRTTVSLVTVPIEFTISSTWGFDPDEMCGFIVRQIRYEFRGMRGAP